MKKRTSASPLKQVVRDIAEVARQLWERGWAERNAGNLSLDITDIAPESRGTRERLHKITGRMIPPELAGRTFYVTATGSRFRETASDPEGNLLMIQIAGDRPGYRILGGRGGRIKRPTSELATHLRIHGFLRKRGLPQKAVLHTHPIYLIALTHLRAYHSKKAVNRLLWMMHPEVKIVLPEGVGLVPYRCPGTSSLAEATLKSLKDHPVVLWEKHGCAAIGQDIWEAFDLIDTVNKAAQAFFLCRMAGFEAEGLNARQVKELEKTWSCKP
jgi:rhamnulose-1-phosphate aldolase